MEIFEEIKVTRYVVVDGIKFYETKQGYWMGTVNKKPQRLHMYMWLREHGVIPPGYHIHHKDGNKANNDMENLELLEMTAHLGNHGKDRDIEEQRRTMDKVREKASEWHKSKEGLEWHRQQYEKTKHLLHKRCDIVCIECGKVHNSGKFGAKFCSERCKSAYRKKSGVDDIMRECEICKGEFKTNKHSSARFCSDECRKKHRDKKNHEKRQRTSI